jgi:Sec-independent protein translocase protein TatA
MVSGLSKRIKDFRERVETKKQARRAKKRAKSREQKKAERKKQADKRARDRRIEKNEPENVREEAAASVRQLKLLSSELGVAPENVREVVNNAGKVLEDAQEQGSDALEQLDVDGDGDTDILQSFESQSSDEDLFSSGGGSSLVQPQGSRGSEPMQPESLEVFDPMSVDDAASDGSGSSQDSIDPTSREFEEDLLDL